MLRLSPSFFRRGLAALSAGALLLASTAGRAEPSASERKLAKEMLREAIDDEKAGKCQEAVDTLRQVVAIVETGETLLHLGECLSRTGHLLEAIKTWERAEDLARRDKDKPTQQALIPKLAELHGRIPTVALHVPADVTGATGSIDGQPLSDERMRAPIELDPGEHTLEVKAAGRSPFSTKLTLAEKATVAVSAVLPSLHPAADEGGAGSSSGTRVGAWISGSAALVLAGGGVGAFIAAGGAASDGRAACAGKASCDAGTVKSVRQLDAAALALWVGAGAGLGLSVTLFVVSRPREGAPPKAAAGAPFRLGVGPGTLQVSGTF
jgi:hypothetical protein